MVHDIEMRFSLKQSTNIILHIFINSWQVMLYLTN